MRSGSPVGTTDREFRIDASDGIISVAGNLDYETTPRYTLTVRATYDADGDTTTTNDQQTEDVDVVIDVELIKLVDADDNPVSSYTASVDEDAAVLASVVTVDASVDGAPVGHRISYSFVGGATQNTDGFFTFGAPGEIIITIDPQGTELDYETTPRHELTVRVTYDSNGNTAGGEIETRDVQVVINVNDVAGQSPAIIPDRQSFAHQDPMEPDDLGLTPMPDADPSAG